MAISSGHLDSLLGMSFDPEALASLSYQSGTAAGSSVNSVTARTGVAPYAAAQTLSVTAVNDSNNTVTVTATINVNDPYGYGTGNSSTVPYQFTVIGTSGNDLLLAANGAAATSAVSAATIAGDIQSNATGALNGDLFTMATDGTMLGSGVALPQTLTFASLQPGTLTVAAALSQSLSSAVTIVDSAANVQANLNALQSIAAASHLTAINLTDGGTPLMVVSASQLSGDSTVLGDISSAYSLRVTGVGAANASSIAGQAHVASVTVSDSGANIAANLDGLQGLLNAGKLSGAAVTDTGFANFSITPTQLSNDQGLLNGITGNFTLTESAAANITMSGLPGHANTVMFTGPASQYIVTAAGDGVNFTVVDNGRTTIGTDHFSNITALKFSDFTDFVAQIPGTNTVTTGNIAELYGAAFGRLPDAPGLAFYQAELKTVPGLSLFSLAQNFIASPEYTAAHNYAQSATGDSNFITDTYTNLLHRAPETGAIPFYQNIINQFTQGMTAGTAAYAAAQAQGHALVLVDISASAEFLGNVQITAAHPADAQHWLYLI